MVRTYGPLGGPQLTMVWLAVFFLSICATPLHSMSESAKSVLILRISGLSACIAGMVEIGKVDKPSS